MSPAEERQIQEFINRAGAYIDYQRAAEEFCKQAGIEKVALWGAVSKGLSGAAEILSKGAPAIKTVGRSVKNHPVAWSSGAAVPAVGAATYMAFRDGATSAPGTSSAPSTSAPQPDTGATTDGEGYAWENHDPKNDPWYVAFIRFLLQMALKFHYTDF